MAGESTFHRAIRTLRRILLSSQNRKDRGHRVRSWSPRLVDDLEIRVSNGSLDELKKGYHKFRVCDVDPERSILTLEWLGTLPEDEDWPDYYGFERTHPYNWGEL